MATVPNYYYNSPWIEAAGRNLADALRPEDPDKLRLREQNKWEFQYKQDKAGQETIDRENRQKASGALSGMYDLQSNPVLGADGKPDVKATEKKAFEYAAEAMKYGGKDVRADVDDALGPLSPSFMKKKLLQKAATDASYDRQTRQLAGALQQITTRGDVQAGLQDDSQDFELRKMREQYELRAKEWNLRGALAARKAGQQPITITPAISDSMYLGLLRHEKTARHRLTDDERFKFMSDATERAQTSRNPVTAIDEVWNERFGNAPIGNLPTHEIPEVDSYINSMFGTDYFTDTYLDPQNPTAPPGQTAAPTAEAPRDFAGTMTPPPASNPFVERGRTEAEMEEASRAQAAADNERYGQTSPEPAAKPTRQKATGKSKSSPIPVKTPADVTKLPKGTWFINPQGRIGQAK